MTVVKSFASNITELEFHELRINTVELQWLEQAWDDENWFQSKVVLASLDKLQHL